MAKIVGKMNPEDLEPVMLEKGMYKCPVCTKLSSRKHNIKMHIRRHTRDKPFRCGFVGCTMAFGWKSSLNQHERLHIRDGDMKVSDLATESTVVGQQAGVQQKFYQQGDLVGAGAKEFSKISPTSSFRSVNSSDMSFMTLEEKERKAEVEEEDEVMEEEQEENFYCEVLVFGNDIQPGLLRCDHVPCQKLFANREDFAKHLQSH